MNKQDVYIGLVGLVVSVVGAAWLCFTAFDKPISAVVMLAIAAFMVGYMNGRG